MMGRLLCAAIAMVAAAIMPARAQEMQFDRSALVQSLLPMVVNITAVVAPAAPEAQVAGMSSGPEAAAAEVKRQLGSGFIIDPKGEIATNYHVVDGADQILITFSNGDQMQAHVVAADRLADVALLEGVPPGPLKAVTWGDSSKVRVGDPVLAIGNPLGVGLSVTGGIVSAVNRDIMETPYDDYIQTDAPINHGNSGGPLFDMSGKVIGINSAIISPTAASAGLGFAIPSRDARFVIGQLRQFGWLHPGWIGLKLQQVTPEMAIALGQSSPHGSIVAAVIPDGPAEKAGIRVGDLVLDFADRHASDERALLRAIGESMPGSAAPIRLERDGKPLALSVGVQEWPRKEWDRYDAPVRAMARAAAIGADLGIKLAPLDSAARAKLGVPAAVPAMLVANVKPGTDAAFRGLRAGDAVLRVQEQPIGSTEAFAAALSAARATKRSFALLLIQQQKSMFPGPVWKAFAIAN